MIWLPEACAHACPICNQNAVTSAALWLKFLRLLPSRVREATRARSLVKRFHFLRAPARQFVESFPFRCRLEQIEQESVVAAMPVLLDAGYMSAISSIQQFLMRLKTKLLPLVCLCHCYVCSGMEEKASKVQTEAGPSVTKYVTPVTPINS
jgi:hypothetical protein